MIDALRQATAGQLDLPTGTIYPALHRLEERELISGSWSVVDGRRRRSYQLTARGRSSLAQRRAEWRELSAAMTTALRMPAWPHPA